jgi:hypothetical protein
MLKLYMAISKYNLCKFIDASLKDQIMKDDPDWNLWFRSVSRIFNHRMPLNVVSMIASAPVLQLRRLADMEFEKIEERRKRCNERREQQTQKHERWKQRRDAGNKRAEEAKRMQDDSIREKAKEHQREADELYVRMMLPSWKQKVDDCKQHRDEEICSIFRRPCDYEHSETSGSDRGGIYIARV